MSKNENIQAILHQYFGYTAFRPMQEDIIRSVMDGNDTLALLPTGGGKSLCYQVPALAQEGLCLVITPLIALMKDQVHQLRRRNISALAIHSGMTFFEVKKAMENACQGAFKFLYLSPERLQTRLFREYLPGMPVNLVAVDEAHCISQWGYDFRPPYLQIATLREELPTVPILALTASATAEVQDDIMEKLQFSLARRVFRQSFARPNLSFSAQSPGQKAVKLVEILKKVPGSALVYCRNRKRTKEIAALLEMHGISSGFYHAGLGAEERNRRQDDWIHNRTRVMACTNAFGMGIDKPDVRCVVHVDLPDSLEAYYQEAGRAGRDGLRAFAVLLFLPDDIAALKSLPDQKFPPLHEVAKVYEAIGHYLQIPVNAGGQTYYDFDFSTFCERFKVNPLLAANALQILAQAGYLSFSEQVFKPSWVQFVAGRSYIEQIEADRPLLEPMIKALLRTYEGILDNQVSISEKTLASILKTDLAQVQQWLKQLVVYQVIEYQPRKETPQVYFLYDRVTVSQLRFDEALYARRKAQYARRLDHMAEYATAASGCRSTYIRNYFGDTAAEDCGICDHCLDARKKPYTREQLALAQAAILKHLHQGLTSLQLRRLCQELDNPLFTAALDGLLAEELIRQRPDGVLERNG